MKKLLFLLVILLFSCHTAKIVTETSTTQKTEQKNDVAVIDTKATTATTATTEQSNGVTKKTVETTVYDTDKPVVPGTNKPPVKSETKETTEQQQNTKKRAVEVIDVSGKTEIADKSQVKTDNNTKSKSVTVPKKSAFVYIWYIVATLIVLSLVVVIWRYWGKIKPIIDVIWLFIKKIFGK